MAPSSLESAGEEIDDDAMTTPAFGIRRAYRLTPDRGPADDAVSLVRIDGAASSVSRGKCDPRWGAPPSQRLK